MSRSKLGRFADGGAILFDGVSAYGVINHTVELNFSYNEFYPRAVSEFTVQMTVHPVGPTTGKVQTLIAKGDEWKLQINAEGKIEWHVHVLSGWLVTTGTRILKSKAGQAYVIKATHAAGTLKLFSCVLGANFQCDLGPIPESFNTSATACSGPTVGWTKTPTCLVTSTNMISLERILQPRTTPAVG